jgi:hypothetical protein
VDAYGHVLSRLALKAVTFVGPTLPAFLGAESARGRLVGARVRPQSGYEWVCNRLAGGEIMSVHAYHDEMEEMVVPRSNFFR